MNQEKVGKFIAEMRKRKKLTQEDIAKHFGITSQAVSKWERGINAPDISILEELAQILDVEVLELLKGEKIDSKNKENIEKERNITIVDGLKFYEKKTKKSSFRKYGVISFLLMLAFIIILSLYFINNYNQVKVYTINSIDELSMNGKIMFNPKQNCVIINKIFYNDINTGTDMELKVKGIDIKIVANDKIFFETGNLDFVDTNDIRTINDYLSDFSIVNMEMIESGGNFIKEDDIDSLKIVLEYADDKGKINIIESSIESYKEFANTNIFY